VIFYIKIKKRTTKKINFNNKMEKELIEKNILNIQKKLQELDSSFQNIEQELIEDVENLNRSGISKKSKYTKNESLNISNNINKKSRLQNPNFENHLMVSKNDYLNKEDNFQIKATPIKVINEGRNNSDHIESLINEIDELKENLRQKDLNMETLNFRYEKIQSELTVKLNQINKLTIELEDKNSLVKKLESQKKYLENTIDQNNANLVPDHQKLKSQYEVLFLEMKSLENDNSILEKRIKDLSELNLLMKNENRDLKNQNYKIELERLENKKNLEILKNNMNNIENDFFDVSEKNESLSVENERLKNELSSMAEKLKIFNKSGNPFTKEILKTDNNFLFNVIPQNENFKKQPEIKKNRPNFEREDFSLKSNKKSNFMENIDKLDFSDIDSLGARLKKANNK
jgi:hypothetical protein